MEESFIALIFNVEITKAPFGLKQIFRGGHFPVLVVIAASFVETTPQKIA
jgi:hypothetical protein